MLAFLADFSFFLVLAPFFRKMDKDRFTFFHFAWNMFSTNDRNFGSILELAFSILLSFDLMIYLRKWQSNFVATLKMKPNVLKTNEYHKDL